VDLPTPRDERGDEMATDAAARAGDKHSFHFT